jgi:hypothetical protein
MRRDAMRTKARAGRDARGTSTLRRDDKYLQTRQFCF